jgi:hypothetical protein
MTDRLPAPVQEGQVGAVVERASATSARATPKRDFASATLKTAEKSAAPSSLRDVQAWMVRAISGSESDALAAGEVVTGGHSLSARERLEIYCYGYRARLVDCLLDDYPVVAQTLGEASFEALCHAYIERHPSSSPSLNAFGRHLSAFLLEATLEGSLAPRPRFLSELAALEWALVEVIHAKTPPPLDLGALQALPPEAWATAWFEPSPAVRLLRFEYPANRYFQKCRVLDEAPPIPEPETAATVVYRHGLTVWRMDLTPAMARVLEALLARVPIGDALAKLGVDESDPAAIAEAERSVMVWFREWVSSGLFAELRLPPA